MLILNGAAAAAAPVTSTPTSPTAQQHAPDDRTCSSSDPDAVVVCGNRQRAYRLDSGVVEAGRHAESNSRSATVSMPAAQAACAQSPGGCGIGLESLDLGNVAIVAVKGAVQAAEGNDWTRPFKPGGPNEYELYKQAKQRREAEAIEAAALRMKRRAEQAEREASAAEAP